METIAESKTDNSVTGLPVDEGVGSILAVLKYLMSYRTVNLRLSLLMCLQSAREGHDVLHLGGRPIGSLSAESRKGRAVPTVGVGQAADVGHNQ
jgi:hypothetical protein